MPENSDFEKGIRTEEAEDGVYPEINERDASEKVEELEKEYDKAMGRAVALEDVFFGNEKGCMTKNFDKHEGYRQAVCDPMMEWSRANDALRTSKNPNDRIEWYTTMTGFWNARVARAQELLDQEKQKE